MVRTFRTADDATPMVLMGYYNPIYIYGVELSCPTPSGRRRRTDRRRSAARGGRRVLLAGAQGGPQFHPSRHADDRRQASAGRARNTSGFVYYVSITGITGAAAPDSGKVGARLRASSGTPPFRLRSASACGAPSRLGPSAPRRRGGHRLGPGRRHPPRQPWARRQGNAGDRSGGCRSCSRVVRGRPRRAPRRGGELKSLRARPNAEIARSNSLGAGPLSRTTTRAPAHSLALKTARDF